MTIAYFVAAAFLIYGALSTIGGVGKPRKPLEPAVAVATTVITAGLAYLLIYAALHI